MRSGQKYYTFDHLNVSIPIRGIIDAIDGVEGIEVTDSDEITVEIDDTDVELDIPVTFDLIRTTDGGERGEAWESFEAETSMYKIEDAIKQEVMSAKVMNTLEINEVEEN